MASQLQDKHSLPLDSISVKFGQDKTSSHIIETVAIL